MSTDAITRRSALMRLVFASPTSDDLIRLLRAWRFWLLGAVLGALIGAAIYYIAPPPFRARATVNVDFHMEEAWPQNTDREQFYYLERETRKLEEIAMSDAVLTSVAANVPGASLQQLRSGQLTLGQPGNGGWHFIVDDRDPKRAVALASAWAVAFASQVQQKVSQGTPGGLEQFITADPTQVAGLVAHRAVSLSLYMLACAIMLLVLISLVLMFVRRIP